MEHSRHAASQATQASPSWTVIFSGQASTQVLPYISVASSAPLLHVKQLVVVVRHVSQLVEQGRHVLVTSDSAVTTDPSGHVTQHESW